MNKKLVSVCTSVLIIAAAQLPVIAGSGKASLSPAENLQPDPFRLQISLKPEAAPVIAVADFANDTGDNNLNHLKRGLANSLITSLSINSQNNLQIVERGQLDSVLKELGLGNSGLVDLKTAAKVGNALGATQIIVGGMIKAGPVLRVNVRMIDVKTARVLAAFSEDGYSEKELLTIIDRISGQLSSRLLPDAGSGPAKSGISASAVQPGQSTGSWGLSFLFPGLGQFSLGEGGKGTFFVLAEAASLLAFIISILNHGGGAEEIAVISGIAAGGIYLWNIFDAFFTWSGRLQEKSSENTPNPGNLMVRNDSLVYQLKF